MMKVVCASGAKFARSILAKPPKVLSRNRAVETASSCWLCKQLAVMMVKKALWDRGEDICPWPNMELYETLRKQKGVTRATRNTDSVQIKVLSLILLLTVDGSEFNLNSQLMSACPSASQGDQSLMKKFLMPLKLQMVL